jgi:signal transduction histidine kinase
MGVARWQRILLSGGLLEPGSGRRTIRDWAVDLLIFAVAVGSGVFLLSSTWDQHSSAVAVLDIALGSVALAALWWRREQPWTVALIVIALSAVSGLAAMTPLPALFNAAIRLPLRRVAALTALAVALSPVFGILYPDVQGRGYGWQVVVGLLLTAVALGWGLFVRAQRELVRGLRERAQDEARAAERRRIAREMHDVLAHRLSILSVHAGAMENGALPPEYKEAAHVIRTSAHLALEELRQVIGLLRPDESVDPIEPPQPTLAQIPALVEESRSVGLSVSYRSTAVGPDVPEVVGRTAYRTVQEGLTNARKHAGEERVELTIGGGPPLIVELVSYGSATGRALPGAGTGLVGIAERVELAGGSLHYGPGAGGAFVLRATLPW